MAGMRACTQSLSAVGPSAPSSGHCLRCAGNLGRESLVVKSTWGVLLRLPGRAGLLVSPGSQRRPALHVIHASKQGATSPVNTSETGSQGFGADSTKKKRPRAKKAKAEPKEDEDDEFGPDPFWGNREVRVVCDRLAEVFLEQKPEPREWKKLLAFSSEWGNIRARFYTRLKQRAKEAEDKNDPDEVLRLLSLQRRLAKVEEEMEMHDKLLADVEAELDWESMIQRRRLEFTAEFFQHLATKADACIEKDHARREELVALQSKLFIAVQTHDQITKDEEAMGTAQAKFLELLDSPDLATIDRKIDDLARKGGLDPALVLMMSKAYVKAKDTDMTRDEVKDVMAHMYFKAKESMQLYVPKEVRILKHLLSMDDPRERFTALEMAFEPGPEIEGETEQHLFTTPGRLLEVIDKVLEAYSANQRHGPMVKEAAGLMQPAVIDRMQQVRETIEKDFL